MRSFKVTIMLIILIYPLSLFGADGRLTVYGGSVQSTDVSAIQKIVSRLVKGLQEQDPYFVYMHFQPDPNGGLKNQGEELEGLKVTLACLFRAFEYRSRIKKPAAGVSSTFDFIDMKKEIHLAPDANTAWADVELGFYTLPGNKDVLQNVPAEEVGAMSENEKEMKSRFVVTRLDFHKIEGAWYLSSLASLDQTLKSLLQHYTEVEAEPVLKTKK